MTELKFKAGDHVMVPMKVTGVDQSRHHPYRVELECGGVEWITKSALASATLIERPLAVGVRVTWIGSGAEYHISSIDDDLAVIRLVEDRSIVALAPLSELRRAGPPAS